MWEIFEKLLIQNGKTMYAVSRATGIAPSTLSDWHAGRTRPKYDKLKKIADYFGVPVEYLTTGVMPPKESDSGKQYAFTDRAAAYAEMLTQHKHLQRLVEAAQNADPDDIRLITEVLERMNKNASAE